MIDWNKYNERYNKEIAQLKKDNKKLLDFILNKDEEIAMLKHRLDTILKRCDEESPK